MTELTEEEKITLATYNEHPGAWSRLFQTTSFWNRELKIFRELLPTGKLLEVGCGGGREAKEFLEIGYDYTGIDISEKLLEKAKASVPEGRFLQQSLYELDFPAKSFDGFWCCAVLLHIPKKRIKLALDSIKRVLKPGAVGFISVKKGQGEEMDTRRPERGERFFAYYTQPEIKQVLSNNGFEIIKTTTTPVTERTTWINLFVRLKP